MYNFIIQNFKNYITTVSLDVYKENNLISKKYEY